MKLKIDHTINTFTGVLKSAINESVPKCLDKPVCKVYNNNIKIIIQHKNIYKRNRALYLENSDYQMTTKYQRK